ncbi:FimV/HubP family polar landmark protein [Marinobacter sp.]|uniref:FimV/HubP family polar landmark protein n=1 Tax=Marinobacter sp. TaxID=50741 RepID=UPI00356234A7
MKVRKLAVALALAGGLGSGVAQALGLGEIELQSYLNQPLNAEIDVNRAGGVSPDDVIVNLASERDYERVGLRRDFFLTQLDFNVTTAPNGELVISVTSREPVREPYLNFLVEVTWPSGRVMREYSVLVDPPVYAEDSDAAQPVQQTRTPSASGQPSTEPRAETRSATAEQPTGTTSSGPRTLDPVQASDTLWEIARSVRPDNSVSMQQVMLAIQDLNPDAFINGNINRLKRGAVLRVPDMDDIRTRTQAEANREVNAQNQAIAQPEPSVDATSDDVAASGSAAGVDQQSTDELRLVVPEDSEEASAEGSAGGDGSQGGSADAGSAVALEELDRARRENEELNSRLQDLQDQVETLERLIELKDSQLAEIQDSAGQPDDGAGGTGDATLADGQSDAETGEDGNDQAGDQASDMADATDEAGNEAEAVADGGDAAAIDQSGEPGADADSSAPEAQADGQDLAAEPAEDEGAGESTEESVPADDPVVASGEQPEQQPAATGTDDRAESEKGFLATAIDLIAGNFMYQIALGGFLVLLLLLVLLISRRRASKDDEFYQQLDDEADDDGFELTLGEQDAADSVNAMEEADRYISYGQHDSAAEVLENAISREPSRSDLRLKLLAVYADTGNRAAFDKQYAELEAMEHEDAQPEAEALRARLEEVESTPSIDELESQLRGRDVAGGAAAGAGLAGAAAPGSAAATSEDQESSELMSAFEELDLPEEESDAVDEQQDDGDIEYDFTGFDTTGTAEAQPSEEEATAGEPEEADDFSGIDFELPEDSDDADSPETPEEEPLDLEDEFSSLELDDAGIDSEPQGEDVEGAADVTEEDDLDFADFDLEDTAGEPEPVDDSINPQEEAELDESFLDELDAELDKVASEDDTSDSLDNLELDVSDEDLALMDQVSDSEPEDESQLDLGDLDLDDGDLTGDDEEGLADNDLSDLEIPELDDLDSELDGEPAVPDTESGKPAGAAGIDEIDEASLGEDDDFDFLSGTDEVATKLDLARAYVDMGDSEGAREILEEVILEGTEDQIGDAQALLKKLP